jgi:iron complex outermembrane receptor protein
LPGVRVVVLHDWSDAEQSTSTLADALNQAVAGLWLWQQQPGAPIAQYGSLRGASSFGITAPKLYIDGIEVANPLLFSRISPDAIERVEIVRGPQGSALFGANAMNGVMNIVTRHGANSTAATRTQVRSSLGLAATDYATGSAARHEHNLNTRLGDSARSLVLNVGAGGVGEFVPDGGGQHYNADASGRLTVSRAILAGTLRFVRERAVTPLSPLLSLPSSTAYTNRAATQSQNPLTVQQYTVGASLRVMPDPSWTLGATIGIDGYTIDGVGEPLPWASDADLALRAAGDNGYRTTARLSTTVRRDLGRYTLGTLHFVAEHTELLQRGATIAFPRSAQVMMRDGPSHTHHHPYESQRAPVEVPSLTSQRSSGVGAQGQLSIADRFFLTGGLRFEQGSSDMDDQHLATLPVIGGSWLQRFGEVEVTMRTSYGKGIRWAQLPVQTTALQRLHAVQRSALVPEEQAGIEAGVDVSYRRLLALHVTRFDQTASGLMHRVSMPLSDTMLAPYALRDMHYELQNVGEIRNRGWELEAAATRGALSLSAMAAVVDSRVTRLAVGYAGDLQPGDRMLAVPATTLGLTAAYSTSRWSLALTGTRAGNWINYDRVALAQAALSGDNQAGDISGAQLRSFWRTYNGVTQLSVRGTRTLRHNVALFFSGENLLDQQIGAPDNITILPGRGLSVGVRANF